MKKGGAICKPILLSMIAFAFAPCLLAAQDPFLTLDTVVQTNGQLQFNLNGEDSVIYMIEGSSDLQNWTPVLTNSDQPATRTITVNASQDFGFYRASRGPLPVFVGAITARSNITMEGLHIFTDSYDSSDTNDFPGGVWNATNRRDHGDVAVGNSSISIGNADIMGKVWIEGTLLDVFSSIGAQGSVGDVPWVTGGETGLESANFAVLDFRFCLPDFAVPYTSGLPLPFMVTNAYVLSSGQYFYNGNFALSASQSIVVTGQASLYVTGSFTMKGSGATEAAIDIQTNASLTLVVGGSSTTLSTINNAGNALAFQYYGLPGNTNVTFGGNTTYLGIVYAPEATITLAGTVDFSGALVGNSIRLLSEINVHYDENLARIGPQR